MTKVRHRRQRHRDQGIGPHGPQAGRRCGREIQPSQFSSKEKTTMAILIAGTSLSDNFAAVGAPGTSTDRLDKVYKCREAFDLSTADAAYADFAAQNDLWLAYYVYIGGSAAAEPRRLLRHHLLDHAADLHDGDFNDLPAPDDHQGVERHDPHCSGDCGRGDRLDPSSASTSTSGRLT